MAKMPFEFDIFKQQCADRGYVRGVIDQSKYNGGNIYAMRTKNGIKTEIKPRWYTTGFGRSQEELQTLSEELTNQGFEILKRNDSCLNISYTKGVDIMERFWVLVEILEGIDGIIAKTRGTATKVFSREVNEQNIYEKIAGRYFYAIESEDQDLLDMARDLLSGDTIDRIISRGESVNCTADNMYREHIVPCIMIHNKAIEMVEAGCSRAEVSQMIACNLAIVRISEDEANHIDVTLGLRTTMPEGWNFGDDVFARLKAGGITLK